MFGECITLMWDHSEYTENTDLGLSITSCQSKGWIKTIQT